jgi:hypothetical protein
MPGGTAKNEMSVRFWRMFNMHTGDDLAKLSQLVMINKETGKPFSVIPSPAELESMVA